MWEAGRDDVASKRNGKGGDYGNNNGNLMDRDDYISSEKYGRFGEREDKGIDAGSRSRCCGTRERYNNRNTRAMRN